MALALTSTQNPVASLEPLKKLSESNRLHQGRISIFILKKTRVEKMMMQRLTRGVEKKHALRHVIFGFLLISSPG